MTTEMNTNMTPRMTKRERILNNITKLSFNGHPAVNYSHVEAEIKKLNEMDYKEKLKNKAKKNA